MGEESTALVKPVLEKSTAGNNHFLKLNFGIHSFLEIPSVRLVSDSVSFTARYLDNLNLPSDRVLIVDYIVGNGLLRCFQIIDSIHTWKRLGKKKTLKVLGLYSINFTEALRFSETFIEDDWELILCQKVSCPRCEFNLRKKDSRIHVCPKCKTKFTTGTKI